LRQLPHDGLRILISYQLRHDPHDRCGSLPDVNNSPERTSACRRRMLQTGHSGFSHHLPFGHLARMSAKGRGCAKTQRRACVAEHSSTLTLLCGAVVHTDEDFGASVANYCAEFRLVRVFTQPRSVGDIQTAPRPTRPPPLDPAKGGPRSEPRDWVAGQEGATRPRQPPRLPSSDHQPNYGIKGAAGSFAGPGTRLRKRWTEPSSCLYHLRLPVRGYSQCAGRQIQPPSRGRQIQWPSA
jgi:hypothetical protein